MYNVKAVLNKKYKRYLEKKNSEFDTIKIPYYTYYILDYQIKFVTIKI